MSFGGRALLGYDPRPQSGLSSLKFPWTNCLVRRERFVSYLPLPLHHGKQLCLWVAIRLLFISNESWGGSYISSTIVCAWNRNQGASALTKPYPIVSELVAAEKYWISLSQGDHFSAEIASLRSKHSIPSNSCLLPLHPFVDLPLQGYSELEVVKATPKSLIQVCTQSFWWKASHNKANYLIWALVFVACWTYSPGIITLTSFPYQQFSQDCQICHSSMCDMPMSHC